jgi:hypothetical protein
LTTLRQWELKLLLPALLLVLLPALLLALLPALRPALLLLAAWSTLLYSYLTR